MGIKTVPQPPYNPDIAPCDFCLFPELKGCRYETIEEIKEALTKVIDMLTQEDFHGAFQKLLERYNKCIAAGGDHLEGDSSFMCVLSIKVAIRKKSGNLLNDPRKCRISLFLDYTSTKLFWCFLKCFLFFSRLSAKYSLRWQSKSLKACNKTDKYKNTPSLFSCIIHRFFFFALVFNFYSVWDIFALLKFSFFKMGQMKKEWKCSKQLNGERNILTFHWWLGEYKKLYLLLLT